ncbi:hypothetical protein [Castellaniella sp.]|uniref:hypothetical protein n=1 Tax=Castellaniella sp. TaxID=1955812 RepID=UPI002AFEC057|nr:hypothetical protein [Castellaniella sp.]
MLIPNHITCWTDYPFKTLGDKPYELAPIRHVKILGWDGNKYVLVRDIETGVVLGSVKCGYLYRNRARLGHGAKPVNPRKIERFGQTSEYYDWIEGDL